MDGVVEVVLLPSSSFVSSCCTTHFRLSTACGRSSYFTSFYRKRPAAANIYFLAMEWANFALSAGFVFVRMVQLMVAAAMNVGRIDAPFLAPGVGEIGPVDLDPFPTVHLRDILATEAHRHPYMEILGRVYLMKLRYGDKFVSNAGSCWRLIFVYALMVRGTRNLCCCCFFPITTLTVLTLLTALDAEIPHL
mmetsp:Transcript_5580/g.11450  ORF Transcript_5580/g.11450 Transcript_5580/m.11450 type:complete len:192 (-) Transcript_5580:578-1153(-)